jgi:hypothetical protein
MTGSNNTEISINVVNLDRPSPEASLNEFSFQVSFASALSAPQTINEPIPSYYYTGAGWQAGDNLSVTIVYERFYTAGAGTSTKELYTTAITDLDSRWYAIDNRNIRISATQSLFYNKFIEATTVAGMETPNAVFSLQEQDLIRLKNANSSWGAFNESEYRVTGITQGTFTNITAATNGTVLFYQFSIDRDLNPLDTEDETFPSYIHDYVVLRRLPDETNLILSVSGSPCCPWCCALYYLGV